MVQGVRFKWKKARTSSFLLPLSGGGNLESRERRGFETHSSHSIRTLFFIFCISELIFVVSCDWARGLGSRRARRRGGGHGGGSGVFRQVFFFVFSRSRVKAEFHFFDFLFLSFFRESSPFLFSLPAPRLTPSFFARASHTSFSLSSRSRARISSSPLLQTRALSPSSSSPSSSSKNHAPSRAPLQAPVLRHPAALAGHRGKRLIDSRY